MVSGCLLASLPASRRFCRLLPSCWPLCQPAGVSAGLCLPGGLSASLPAFLPVSSCLLAFLLACRRFCRSLAACWPFCQPSGVSAGLCLPVGFCAFLLVFVLCSIRFGLPGDSRMLFFLSSSAWSFAFRWLHCFRASDLCRLHLLCFHVFSCPVFNLGCPC